MGGSPKRGGSNGGSAIISRGRVILVAVLVLQLVLVVCLMKAPHLIFSSSEERVDGPEAVPAASSAGSWLWRKFVISTTAPNCTDASGRVVTEAAKGSDIKCSDRSSLLRMKWTESPKHRVESMRRATTAEVASGQLRKVNATTVFRNFRNASTTALPRRGRANARSELGNLRPLRVQVGRVLPATGDPAMARSEAAQETKKSSSLQFRREFAANLRSSLERDNLRFRGRTVGYGNRQRSSSGGAPAKNESASISPAARISTSNVSAAIAPVASNVSASIAPDSGTLGSNVSAPLAKIGVNAGDSDGPVARSGPSALLLNDEQPEDEEDELPEEEDPDVGTARSEVSFGGRRGPLPSFNVARRSNTSLEISMKDTSSATSPTSMSFAELSTRNSSVAEFLPSNSSLEIATRNTSLAELSSRNSSLTELSLRNTSLEISPSNTSLAEMLTRNTSLAEYSLRNTSLGISPSNASLNISPTSTQNATVETSLHGPTRNTSLEGVKGKLTSLSKEIEQVAASPLSTSSAAEQNATLRNATTDAIANSTNATCSQGLIYVYKLPKQFNVELLENCSQLLAWGDRCLELSNAGLGPALNSSGPWYGTDQFNGEVIFHNRILSHPCRTHNPELAQAFYVPYYGGLDVARFLFNVTGKTFSAADRDELGGELVAWLSRSPYWKRHQGLDHFLFLGRITWDFRRKGSHGWGSRLFQMPEMANVTKLALERSPYDGSEMAIPYPTGFHPRNDTEVVQWQAQVRTKQREFLFSFAGAKRKEFPNDFRGALLHQCTQAQSCAVLDCSQRKCEDDTLAATKLFMKSTFCLQPRGDSFTRRSIFDSLIAGCIPVFFWSKSAYLQYKWHLPADYASYSVFIPKKSIQNGVKIEDVLSKIPPAKVKQMQETVLGLIPGLVYSPQGLTTFRDAFDTTIDNVMAHFRLQLQHNASSPAGSGINQALAPVSTVPQALGNTTIPATSSKPAATARA